MKYKEYLFTAVLISALLVLNGCGPCPPEVSGADERLLELERKAAAQAQIYNRQYPTAPPVSDSSIRGKTILIDAGHGGRDPGTLGVRLGGAYGLPEKTIVLDIAKKIAARLEAKGANVRMSRTTDNFLELDQRAALANRYNADALVSIHADYSENFSASGPSCYVARQASSQSERIAQAVIKEFELNGIRTRGVRRANYRVLVAHPKPSTLIEVGFLSNQTEARNLNTDSYRTKIASIIADGIAKSF